MTLDIFGLDNAIVDVVLGLFRLLGFFALLAFDTFGFKGISLRLLLFIIVLLGLLGDATALRDTIHRLLHVKIKNVHWWFILHGLTHDALIQVGFRVSLVLGLLANDECGVRVMRRMLGVPGGGVLTHDTLFQYWNEFVFLNWAILFHLWFQVS